MLRKVACAVVVLAVSVGFAMADEMFGVITKVNDGKITFKRFSKEKKGEEMTLSVAPSVKVTTGKFNKETKKLEAGEELAGGLKNERLQKLGEKGLLAVVVTDASNKVTEIRVAGGKKKEAK